MGVMELLLNMIRLLCINPSSNYELVDNNLLYRMGVDVWFVVKRGGSSNKDNIVYVEDFTLTELRKATSIIEPDRIVSFYEELFEVVANLNCEFGLRGLSKHKSLLFSNKRYMYKILSGVVNVPKTIQLNTHIEYSNLRAELKSDSIFIKPDSKAGSIETYVIRNEEQYKWYLSNKKLEIQNYIAQPYINGDLYHSEMIVQDGTVRFINARKYSSPNSDMVLSKKPVFSYSLPDESIKKSIISSSMAVKTGMNINNAILHTEFFIENETQKVYFVETNLRAPGIGLNYLYKMLLGISLETCLCLIISDIKLKDIKTNGLEYICGYYPMKTGIAKKINDIELGVKADWRHFVDIGRRYEESDKMSKSSMVICYSDNQSKLMEQQTALCSHVPVTFEL